MNEKKNEGLKDVELKLISELLRNSRRSDRELAKTIGCSQPTVTRTRQRLEKEGYIGQYTLIPNFSKLGYKILAITFVKFRRAITVEEIENSREVAKEVLEKGPDGIVMVERGIGLGYECVLISYHRSYFEYTKLQEWFRQFVFLEADITEGFLIDLDDKIRYHPLGFASLAHHLMIREKGGREP